jgi:hypothetical protein
MKKLDFSLSFWTLNIHPYIILVNQCNVSVQFCTCMMTRAYVHFFTLLLDHEFFN